jgi:hypothetical protein
MVSDRDNRGAFEILLSSSGHKHQSSAGKVKSGSKQFQGGEGHIPAFFRFSISAQIRVAPNFRAMSGL